MESNKLVADFYSSSLGGDTQIIGTKVIAEVANNGSVQWDSSFTARAVVTQKRYNFLERIGGAKDSYFCSLNLK